MHGYLGLRGRPLVYAVNVVTANSYLLFGYDNGLLSGIITSPQFFDVFQPMSATMQGTVVALLEVGAFFGAITCLFTGNRLGRRVNSFIGSSIMIIGAVLHATSSTRVQLIVGRIVSGWGLGMLTSTAPPYISECSTPKERGRDIGIMLSSLIIGINAAYWIDYGCSFIDGAASFRIPMAMQIVFCLIICVTVFFIPDSPRWLYHRGREDEGLEALCALRNRTEQDQDLLRERDDILQAIALEKDNKHAGWRAIFVDGGVRGNKRVLLAAVTLFFQHLSGTESLTYYSTVIYQQSVGLSRNLALLMGGFLQVWFLVASVLTWYLIGRFGRRQLFILGYLGMGGCFLLLTGMLCLPTSNKAGGIVATFATFMAQGFFTWGLMANTWSYPSEVLPLSLRTQGSAWTAASSWAATFLVVEITPPGIANLNQYFYLFFVGFNITMAIVVYFLYPETAGLSLEAVDVIFTEDYTSWRGAIRRSLVMRKEAMRRDTEQAHPRASMRRDSRISDSLPIERQVEGDKMRTA